MRSLCPVFKDYFAVDRVQLIRVHYTVFVGTYIILRVYYKISALVLVSLFLFFFIIICPAILQYRRLYLYRDER